MVQYLPAEEILLMHAQLVEATGGGHGVRDLNLFLTIVAKPEQSFGGKERFPTVWEKAAVLFDGFARHQVFTDGNKRTGAAAAARFLHVNGYALNASNEELEQLALDIAAKKIGIKKVARQLQRLSTAQR